MTIGVAAIGRVSEDTGGRNYLEHFLPAFLKAAERDPSIRIKLFLSTGEREKLTLPSGIDVIEIPLSAGSPILKVFGEQILLPPAIRLAHVDIMYFPGNMAPYTMPVPYILNIRATAH